MQNYTLRVIDDGGLTKAKKKDLYLDYYQAFESKEQYHRLKAEAYSLLQKHVSELLDE
jgi:hypothetical protein